MIAVCSPTSMAGCSLVQRWRFAYWVDDALRIDLLSAVQLRWLAVVATTICWLRWLTVVQLGVQYYDACVHPPDL